MDYPFNVYTSKQLDCWIHRIEATNSSLVTHYMYRIARKSPTSAVSSKTFLSQMDCILAAFLHIKVMLYGSD
jgi:hypothetical protein